MKNVSFKEVHENEQIIVLDESYFFDMKLAEGSPETLAHIKKLFKQNNRQIKKILQLKEQIKHLNGLIQNLKYVDFSRKLV